jgi:transposase-like protein
MPEIVQVGDFCPNEACPDYGKLQKDQTQKNIKKFGKTPQGKQRYLCKTCGETFAQTKGTLFYRRRTPEKQILETLALVGEGVRISSLSRAKGHKEDTILDWVRQAGKQAFALEEVLLKDYRLGRGQLDALWSYVGNKGEKKTMLKRRRLGSSGDPR